MSNAAACRMRRATQAVDPAEDARLWQGTWKMVHCTWNGEPQPGDVQWIVQAAYYLIRLDQQIHSDPLSLQPGRKPETYRRLPRHAERNLGRQVERDLRDHRRHIESVL